MINQISLLSKFMLISLATIYHCTREFIVISQQSHAWTYHSFFKREIFISPNFHSLLLYTNSWKLKSTIMMHIKQQNSYTLIKGSVGIYTYTYRLHGSYASYCTIQIDLQNTKHLKIYNNGLWSWSHLTCSSYHGRLTLIYIDDFLSSIIWGNNRLLQFDFFPSWWFSLTIFFSVNDDFLLMTCSSFLLLYEEIMDYYNLILFILHRANATYFGNGWKPLFNSSYIEISYILCMFWYQWGMFFLYLSKY
jgi:hypothetical protein